MRRTWTLLGFVAGVFVTGALIAPWLYRGVQSLATQAAWLENLAAHPFPRFVSRTLMILAVVGLWPLSRRLCLAVRDVGLKPFCSRDLLRGAALGLLTLGLFILLALMLDGRRLRVEITFVRLVRGLGTALGAAVAVGFLEELIFRGVVFGAMRPELGWKQALLVSSILFSAVHFLQSPKWSGPVHWWSGFQLLGEMWTRGAPVANRAAQAVNLVLCGGVLAWAFYRTGTLWFAIGLHGGWIFWLKVANVLTLTAGPAASAWWGTRKVIDGWGVLPFLLVSFLVAAKMTARRAPADVFTQSRNTAAVG